MEKQTVSLIITVKNDAEGLNRLLQDLSVQTVLPMEICLSIASSSDKTLSLAQKWVDQFPIPLVIFPCGEATRSEGRNQAVKKARGSIFIFTDVGCRPEQDWIEQLVKSFEDEKIGLVGGLTLGDPHTLWEEVQVPYVLVSSDDIGPYPLPATRNMAVKRTTWKKIGPFSPKLQFAEDFEWSRRAVEMGIQPQFQPKAVVYWRPRRTPREFFTMIHRLTMGDMLAETWRKGHATMWFRYMVFLIIFSWLISISWPQALVFSLMGLILYSLLKAKKFQFSHKATYLYIPCAQILADMAVLSGTARGLALRLVSDQNRK